MAGGAAAGRGWVADGSTGGRRRRPGRRHRGRERPPNCRVEASSEVHVGGVAAASCRQPDGQESARQESIGKKGNGQERCGQKTCCRAEEKVTDHSGRLW